MKKNSLVKKQTDLMSKLESLKTVLSEMQSVLIAYSGGVDSTFLLKVASGVLGNKAVAVTACSETYPSNELKETKKNANLLEVKHIIINTNELDDPNFAPNTPERCYYCKKELFTKLRELAKQHNLNHIADGSNCDDTNDFRPGMKASEEFGVRSPLKEAAFTKWEIRTLSKEMDLPTWDKAAQPCLSTRFPYGTRITREKLLMVDRAEKFLSKFGANQLRVRVHGNIARIEVSKPDMSTFINEDTSREIVNKLKELGFMYVALDIQGYRMGSMNEPLKKET